MNPHKAIDEKMDPWFVLGAGAMGCLWSVALTRHLQNKVTQPVTLLLRDDSALARYPGFVTLEHSDSPDIVSSSTVVPAISVARASPDTLRIKRLLLSCKAQDAEAAYASVADFLDERCVVVLLQNGMRFQHELSRRRPPGTVFCLSTSSGAWLREPFYAVEAGTGEAWLGNLYADNTEYLQRMQEQLLEQLPLHKMNIHIDQNMKQRLWEKLAINCAINGLTVVYNCRNGELLTNPSARQHCEALCGEITVLLHKIPQAPEMPDLWQRVQQVALTTRDNISSTLQDVRRQRPTEIEHLNGYLCDLAKQNDLPCPLNQQVLTAVLESARLSGTNHSPAV